MIDIWYDDFNGEAVLVANTQAKLDILGRLLAESESTAEAYELYQQIISYETQLENVA